MPDTTIYKYPIPIEDAFRLELPEGAEVLTVQVQSGKPCIWAKVNKETNAVERRYFHLHGTGHDLHPSAGRYVGTFQMYEGALIFHLFEENV